MEPEDIKILEKIHAYGIEESQDPDGGGMSKDGERYIDLAWEHQDVIVRAIKFVLDNNRTVRSIRMALK